MRTFAALILASLSCATPARSEEPTRISHVVFPVGTYHYVQVVNISRRFTQRVKVELKSSGGALVAGGFLHDRAYGVTHTWQVPGGRVASDGVTCDGSRCLLERPLAPGAVLRLGASFQHAQPSYVVPTPELVSSSATLGLTATVTVKGKGRVVASGLVWFDFDYPLPPAPAVAKRANFVDVTAPVAFEGGAPF